MNSIIFYYKSFIKTIFNAILFFMKIGTNLIINVFVFTPQNYGVCDELMCKEWNQLFNIKEEFVKHLLQWLKLNLTITFKDTLKIIMYRNTCIYIPFSEITYCYFVFLQNYFPRQWDRKLKIYVNTWIHLVSSNL